MSKRRRARKPAAPAPSSQTIAPAAVASAPGPGRRLERLGLAALLLLAVLAGYWPALDGGFIWDDKVLLTENPLVKASDGLYRFWFTTEPPDYWPMTSTTFWLEWRLWGLESTGYHVTNLVLHVVEALLLWALLGRLGIGGAYLAALVFAVHPVNVESVAWISQRKNLVAMLFFLPAILCYLEADARTGASTGRLYARGAGRWYWLSLALFLLALLGKGSVATLPALLLLIVWWRRRRLGFWDLVRIVPFVALAAVLVLVNIWFQTHGTGPIRDAGLAERLAGAGAVVWFYLSKALVPLDLAFVYPQWQVEPHRPIWWLPLLAALGVSAALWRWRAGRARPFFLAWVFFCVSLLPVMGLTDVYFMKYSLVADHYQHVAIIGVIGLLAAGWSAWLRRSRGRGRQAAVALAVAVVSVLTYLTTRQAAIYRDEETIYRATIALNPTCWLAHYNLGVDLSERGQRREAFSHLEQAVQAKPDFADARNNLALALSEEGRAAEALAHVTEAVRIKPDLPEARVNLGSMLTRAGRPAEALPHLERAIRLRPKSSQAHHNLGLALAALGRLPEAMGHYREALRLEPGSAQAHNALGTGWLEMGRYAEAISELAEALRLEPEYAEAHGNLALALARSGRPAEAIGHYEQALRLKPAYPEAHYNLGTLLSAAGRRQEAARHFEQALRIRPEYAEAHNNLAIALFSEGRTGEALAHFEEAVRLKPEFLEARVNLAATYARSGRLADAVAQGRAALRLAPPDGRAALEDRIRAWRARGGSR